MPINLKLICANGHDSAWSLDCNCQVIDLDAAITIHEPTCTRCGARFATPGGRYVAAPDGVLVRSTEIDAKVRDRATTTREQTIQSFRDGHYIRHNQRRQEHLASLGLPLEGRSVLELGAGIGDHTTFFIDRNCSVCVSDGRQELYEILRDRYHWMRTELLDLENPDPNFTDIYEIVYAYGLLYHLNEPAKAIDKMSKWCGSLLLLETCVSMGDEVAVNLISEPKADLTQAVSGTGCRPTRRWIFEALRRNFKHVYATVTQPWHPEFPIDWGRAPKASLTRAVFVASRTPLGLPTLTKALPNRQRRH